jgi:hypothetical protein
MKTRQVVIFNGKRFKVPEHIQRIDAASTHGWQVRYGPYKMFSDGTRDGSGAAASLERATKELRKRIAKLPAPTGLQTEPSANKTSDLPVGISGPIVRQRKDRNVPECSFGVHLPRFGQKPLRRSVYIASANTYTVARYNEALAKAVALRQEAERLYQEDATRAKRKAFRPAKPK